jgi:hypothetical protein
MSFDVYSSSKPAAPMRAWASSFGLLVGVTALAWSMTAGRTEGHLGAVESSLDWGFSFRLPVGFKPMDVKAFKDGTIRRYKSTHLTFPLIFSVWSFEDAEKLTADRACDLVLKASSDSPRRAKTAGSVIGREAMVGGFPGKEVESPALAMVVRAVVTDKYAVAFALNGIEPVAVQRGYGAFDQSCRSVEFAVD